MKDIRVYAPSSVSNVGPGFDIFGFALDCPGDEVTLRKSKNKNVLITKIIGDEGKLSYDIKKNTATIALLSLLKKVDYKKGLEIEIKKNIPIGGGLGSSAASACASVFAANELLNLKFSAKDLIEFALAGEKYASGSYHCDNVAPSLLGGFILARSCSTKDIISVEVPKNLVVTVLSPSIEIKTQEARDILPKKVPLDLAVKQSANTAALLFGFLHNNINIIKDSLRDYLIEPYRAKLIPNYHEVIDSAKNEGAIGCGISGSGPAIFALSDDMEIAKKVGYAMKSVYQSLHIESCVYTSKINYHGPYIK